MWKKTTLAILAAALTAGSAMQPVAAQGYYDRDRNYNGQYNDPYYDRQYNNQYNNQYNTYDNRYRDPSARPEPYRYSADQDPYYRDCVQQRQNNTAGGLIIGAIAGGVLGNAVSRGPQRGPGTALGALLGGAVGAGIGSNLNCEDRGYVYRTYYSGFERGRPHSRYAWRSPRTSVYGYLEVGDYYRGPEGYRCATYTQRIYVRGRPEVAAGHACRQPDGNWVLVD
jgi:surface antigen